MSESTSINNAGIKLPKLDLPCFTEDVLKFMTYWDQFKCAVYENQELSEVQKFTYLRSTLKESALHAIEGFEVTVANYEHAVAAILHRFGRKRIIVASLVKSIIKLEMKEKANAASLRDLHDTLKNRIRALEGLGFKPEDNTHVQMILIPLLEMKLPQYLAEKWELELSDIADEKITIDRFFRFLNRQVVSKEAGERSSIENALASSQGDNHSHSFKRKVDRSRPGNMGKRNRPVISSASAFDSGVKQQSDSSCAFCGKKDHETVNCSQAKKKSVDERWKQAKDKKLCFNCLRPTNNFHNSGNCRQPSCTAEGCGKKHHRLLHQETQTVSAKEQHQPQTEFSGLSKQIRMLLKLCCRLQEPS